jgi:hypothetical protein
MVASDVFHERGEIGAVASLIPQLSSATHRIHDPGPGPLKRFPPNSSSSSRSSSFSGGATGRRSNLEFCRTTCQGLNLDHL